MRAAVAETVERFGGLDVASPTPASPRRDGDQMRMVAAEEWERVIDVNLLGVWRTVRAALPQVAERQGHIVVVSSVYAFVNGMLSSAYAVAKSGVEALGRSLRTELAPLGASASVAYFGFVDTKMVQDAFAKPSTRTPRENRPRLPAASGSRPAEAGAAVVRGIEERAPRTFAPKWWRYVSALRGLINPLLDRRVDSDPRVREAILGAEALADEQSAAASPQPLSR